MAVIPENLNQLHDLTFPSYVGTLDQDISALADAL
jgi:hypothetical protein